MKLKLSKKKSKKKQPSFKSPEATKATPQVVTLQKEKQARASEDSSNDSTEDDDETPLNGNPSGSAAVTMTTPFDQNLVQNLIDGDVAFLFCRARVAFP